jgi:hypothetical protein
MTTDAYTVRKVASRNFNVIDEHGEPLRDTEGNPIRFVSSTAAKAEIAASRNDEAETEDAAVKRDAIDRTITEAEVEALKAGRIDVVVEQSNVDIAAMPRSDRLLAAKAEAEALRVWRASGATDPCTRPMTPILDWLADPDVKSSRRTGTHRKMTVRSAEDDARLDRIVTEARAEGKSWRKVAEALNEAGVPTGQGAAWRDTTAWTVGKRLGLVTV